MDSRLSGVDFRLLRLRTAHPLPLRKQRTPEELVGKTLIAITNLPPRKMMGIDSCGMLLSTVNNKKDSDIVYNKRRF
jgi:hypothetical protein